MADETTQQSSADETGAAEAPEVSGASTPEDIEAYWRNRISGSDKAHAAAEKVLRDQLAAAQGKPAQAASADGDVTAYRDLAKQLQTELEQERLARVTDTRTAKYPAAAEALGDTALIAQMDEARLASLNESLRQDTYAPRPVDTNNPQRVVKGPKALADMSIEELKAHLRTLPVPTSD